MSELSKESTQNIRNTKSILKELENQVKEVGEKINQMQEEEQYPSRHSSRRPSSVFGDKMPSRRSSGNKISKLLRDNFVPIGTVDVIRRKENSVEEVSLNFIFFFI